MEEIKRPLYFEKGKQAKAIKHLIGIQFDHSFVRSFIYFSMRYPSVRPFVHHYVQGIGAGQNSKYSTPNKCINVKLVFVLN